MKRAYKLTIIGESEKVEQAFRLLDKIVKASFGYPVCHLYGGKRVASGRMGNEYMVAMEYTANWAKRGEPLFYDLPSWDDTMNQLDKKLEQLDPNWHLRLYDEEL